MKPKLQHIIVILGSTASGKSAYAVRLAQKINGEVISADSRQVYRGLNIGTAKITKKEMKGIRHYGLNIANPKKIFTADDFKKAADKAIAEIVARGKIPILVGGTGFYIDTTIYHSNTLDVTPNWGLRRKLEKESKEALFIKLKKLDPRRAKNIDRYNKRRLIRALEILHHTKKPIPQRTRTLRYDAEIIGIAPPKEKLKKRISKRVTAMIRLGLVREVQSLIKKHIPKKRIRELGFEYKYPLFYLDGAISKNEMIEKIKTETWHYAKRQLTYFKKMENVHWIISTREAEKLIKESFSIILK